MSKNKPFELPKAILNMLGECTNGYYLVTVNDQNEFKVFVEYPNQVIEMALLNYVDMQSTVTQEVLRQQAIEEVLDACEEDSSEEDPNEEGEATS